MLAQGRHSPLRLDGLGLGGAVVHLHVAGVGGEPVHGGEAAEGGLDTGHGDGDILLVNQHGGDSGLGDHGLRPGDAGILVTEDGEAILLGLKDKEFC